jgi:hypothetical protein
MGLKRLVNGFGIVQSLRSPPRRGILPLLALATPNRSASLPQCCLYLIVARVGLTLKRWN